MGKRRNAMRPTTHSPLVLYSPYWPMILALLVSGCAGTRGGAGEALEPEACNAKPMRGGLPDVSTVVDSVELARDVGGISFAFQGRSMAVTVVYGFDGGTYAEATETNLSDDQSATLLSAVRRRLRSRPPGDSWATRLRLRVGANAALTLERADYCAPELETASLRGPRQTVTVIDRAAVRRAFRAASGFRIRVFVSADGDVMAVTDVQRGAPIWGVIHDEVREWRFRPATADGVPLESTVEYEAWQLGALASRIR